MTARDVIAKSLNVLHSSLCNQSKFVEGDGPCICRAYDEVDDLIEALHAAGYAIVPVEAEDKIAHEIAKRWTVAPGFESRKWGKRVYSVFIESIKAAEASNE